jgi:hypothetical protein
MWAWRDWKRTTYVSEKITVQYSFKLIMIIIIIIIIIITWSSLNTAFNFKQNTWSYIAKNGVRPAIDLKIICLARVRFEFETPGRNASVTDLNSTLCFFLWCRHYTEDSWCSCTLNVVCRFRTVLASLSLKRKVRLMRSPVCLSVHP